MSSSSRSVHVRGLPELGGLQDKVTGYFQSGSLSAGGAVTRVKLLGPGQAVVTFADETVAQNVLAQPQHSIQGTRIKVTACPPHLDVPEVPGEDTEETDEKAAGDETNKDEKESALSEEEVKLEEAGIEELQSQGSVKELMKRFESPDPMTFLEKDRKERAATSPSRLSKTNQALDCSAIELPPSDDDESPQESPTPKCLPVQVSHGTRDDESEAAVADNFSAQNRSPLHQQANADSKLSKINLALDCSTVELPPSDDDETPEESPTPRSWPAHVSHGTRNDESDAFPAPPKIPPTPPKPTVPPKPPPKPTTSASVPLMTAATSPQHSNLTSAPMGSQEQLQRPKPTFPQHPHIPNTSIKDQLQQQLHPIPHCISSVTSEATVTSSQHSNKPNAPMEGLLNQPHPKPTTGFSVPNETTSSSPQHPNLPNTSMGGQPQQAYSMQQFTSSEATVTSSQQTNIPNAPMESPHQPYPTTRFSVPTETTHPSPQHPTLNTSMGPEQPQQPWYPYWHPHPQWGMMYPRQPMYQPQFSGSFGFRPPYMPYVPYGDTGHGVPGTGRGGIPPSGVPFQGHPASGPQSSFFPQVSHSRPPGQPTGNVPPTGARSSPQSELLYSYHQPSSSESARWASPRTGSPVSLPFQQQNRSHGYHSDQESSVRSRQTPTELSDEESNFEDALDSVSCVGSVVSDGESFVHASSSSNPASWGRKETTRPLGAAAKTDHHSSTERNRKEGKTTPDIHETPSSITIQVSGFLSGPNEEMLRLYFENKKRSGGEDIQEFEVRDNKVFIVFKDRTVARHVLSREHCLDETVLKLKEVQPRSLDNTRLLVKGFKESTTKETLSFYLENISNDDVITVDYSTQPGVALVTFNKISNFDRMVAKAQSRPLEGQRLTLERVPVTDAIIVTDLPDTVSRDLLELYFESETNSGGGPISDIKMDSSTGTAVVQFDDIKTVNRVHQKSPHILNNKPVSVKPYYECLGEVVDDDAPGAFKMPQPINIKIKPELILFAFAMPKFVEQLESKLKEVHAEVDKTVTEEVKISPTLKPKMKDVRKLARQWEDKSRSSVEEFFTQFQAMEIHVASNIWQRTKDRFEKVSEKVSNVASKGDDLWVQCSDEKDGGGVVTLIGTSEAVTEAELVCKTFIEETEKQLKLESTIVTDNITNMKAAKLKILKLNNLQEKHPDVEIKFDIDKCSVGFKGQQALVQNAKIDLLETTNNLAEERVSLPRGKLSYLKSDRGRKHLEDSLKKNDIKAAFATKDEEMTILALQDSEVKAAKDLLQQVVSESPVAVAEESRDLLSKQGFASLSADLRQRLSVDIHVAKDKVWVVGPAEKVATASKEIKSYIAKNTIVTINMDVAEGTSKFLNCYRNAKVKDVEKKHADQLVQITIDRGKLTVRGTKDGTQSARKELQDLIDDVATDTMNIIKPGMHKFFTEGTGNTLLKGIEKQVKCVIMVGGKPGAPARATGRIRAAAASGPPGDPNQVCSHTMRGGQKLVVVQGDLTSRRVDVMVNTANGTMVHGGGLAAAIVRAGGPEIKRDCDKYVKENGKLTEGQVMSTKGYKLPCKMVVHAVGPQWIAGEEDSREKILMQAVENALLEARDHHSIAIPAISSGIFGYPIKPCVAAIVSAVTTFFNNYPDCALSEVYFTEMDPKKTDAFKDEFLNRFGRDKVTMSDRTATSPSRPTPLPRTAGDAASGTDSPSNALTTPEGITILLKKGDITAEKADVLVNMTSNDLDLSQGGVAKAFGQAGGQELQQLCKNHGKADAGDVVITQSAGTLRCKEVYHGVLPHWQESDQPLRTMVQECLESADNDGYTSIAFPAMGTGNLKYPRGLAASCMYDEILSFSQSNPGTTLKDVRIIVFDQPTVQAFETELRVRQGVPGAAKGSGPYSAVTTPKPGQQQMTIGSVTVQIQGGDLTTENVDCIVNVSSKDLDLSGPMAKAICQKAGPSVATECQQYIRKNGQQDNGAVVLTGAGKLPYKGILHLTHPNANVLKKSIKTCLQVADKRGFKSIAFPAVGTGGFKISPDQAASLMMDGVADFAQQGAPTSLTTVRITVFQQQMLQNFHSEMDRRAQGLGHKTKRFSAVKSRFKKVARSLGKKSRVAKILGLTSFDGKHSVGDSASTPKPLLLQFFGTDRTVGVAKKRVQETVDGNFKEEKIDDLAVLQLSQDEVDMLKVYGHQNSVSVKVDQGGCHCITIQGITDVTTVVNKVWEVLHAKKEEARKMEQALSLQKDISWHYEKPDGTYTAFDPLINLQIEEAYRKNRKGKVQYEDDVGQCEIDFSTMKEKASGQTSNVRRDDLKASAVTSAVPSHWDPQPTDPKSKKPKLCHLVKLKSSSTEYKTVSSKFGLGNIVSIERVQNPTLWSQYCAQKQKISLKNPGKNIEQELWHGSSADSCVKIYHNGFNRSYAGVHGVAIGKGTYFATNASYSAGGYASPDASGHKRLFLAKVLTGLSTPGNSSMIVPPPRPGGGPLDTYDSTSGSGMFCVFHDAQAYPEYLITFT
ncbi:protein mono-ADP-ribosyltransferase PARP14-like isoform X2 [Branchiostoma floridae x Branchiostoma belcheri]